MSPDFQPTFRFVLHRADAYVSDRKEVEIHCFHDHQGVRTDVTERIYRLTERAGTRLGVADEEVARLVLDSEIDILIDLAGHSAHNRMRLFAMKPAPLQFTWLGYLCCPLLMDYRSGCDARCDRSNWRRRAEGGKVFERPVRMPDSQWCYEPQVPIADSSPLPRLANGYWTFGSFNQESKLNDVTLLAWARVLAAIPDSRLRIVGVPATGSALKYKPPNGCVQRSTGSNWSAEFRSMLTSLRYRDVDVALDSYPYNGATTTCDALIMGVPVATIAGGRAISRGGVSLMTTVGLPEWVASSPDGPHRVLAMTQTANVALWLHYAPACRSECAPLR